MKKPFKLWERNCKTCEDRKSCELNYLIYESILCDVY